MALSRDNDDKYQVAKRRGSIPAAKGFTVRRRWEEEEHMKDGWEKGDTRCNVRPSMHRLHHTILWCSHTWHAQRVGRDLFHCVSKLVRQMCCHESIYVPICSQAN